MNVDRFALVRYKNSVVDTIAVANTIKGVVENATDLLDEDLTDILPDKVLITRQAIYMIAEIPAIPTLAQTKSYVTNNYSESKKRVDFKDSHFGLDGMSRFISWVGNDSALNCAIFEFDETGNVRCRLKW